MTKEDAHVLSEQEEEEVDKYKSKIDELLGKFLVNPTNQESKDSSSNEDQPNDNQDAEVDPEEDEQPEKVGKWQLTIDQLLAKY